MVPVMQMAQGVNKRVCRDSSFTILQLYESNDWNFEKVNVSEVSYHNLSKKRFLQESTI